MPQEVQWSSPPFTDADLTAEKPSITGPITLYHGCTKASADAIKSQGLVRVTSQTFHDFARTKTNPAFYITPNKDLATWFAQERAQRNGEKTASVVTITLTPSKANVYEFQNLNDWQQVCVTLIDALTWPAPADDIICRL